MLNVSVGRQMTQRRSLDEVRENIEYLANLPRSTSLKIEQVEVVEPEQDGLLYHYRGVIHYVPKKNEKPERIKRDEGIALMRVRRACEHKRWGRAPWYIIDDAPSNGHSAPPVEDGDEIEESPFPTRSMPSVRSSFTPELPDDDLVEEAAGKFNMVSDATRLKVILILAQRERNVTELCEDLGSQSQPAVSHHLSILRHCRLVEQRRDGKHNFYDLTDEGQELADLIAPLFHGALALEDER